ncbi:MULTISPECIES: ogr/Delta-like zinc finger family protein [Pseudomonas]|jgi:predicted RNA-binding Zn-ribbon protein involved in translation (DUF1610 family)|uniref:ogr/Delta-like zinc finger family protein n=1 Tax=Pseudomonas TaxID=286 RepID=UPI0027DBE720|nr:MULTISPECIES: ogr/Delta-like zinc finger family protein [Pseudomonas]
MAASTANPQPASSESDCERASYNLQRFKSWAGSMMLGPSRFGGLLPVSAIPKVRPQVQAKRRCPDCGAALIKRSSNSEHALMSKTLLVCKNAVCGATFTGIDEITHRLSPPSRPNPEIQLPYAPSAIRRGVLKELGLLTHDTQLSTLSHSQNKSEVRP